MVSIVVVHILLLLLGLGIASRAIPTQLVSNMLGYLHKTIGITTTFGATSSDGCADLDRIHGDYR